MAFTIYGPRITSVLLLALSAFRCPSSCVLLQRLFLIIACKRRLTALGLIGGERGTASACWDWTAMPRCRMVQI